MSEDVVDPESIGTVGTDGFYTPAPPEVRPDEPPVGPGWGGSALLGGAEVTPLRGEPGYTGEIPQAIPKG
jgi:hypothetical protein